MVSVVARLTSENRVHELVRDQYRGETFYSIQTAVDGKHVAMTTVSREQAMEWCDTTKRCGGVVYGREVG
jgi:hypothetical protein